MENRFDIVIVGGGMVGAALACALGATPLRIAVLESQLPEPFSAEQPRDLRVSALSYGSENILRSLGAWQGIVERRSCPYRRLKTWELSEAHLATEFDAHEGGYDHLGHIVENRVVQLALLDRLKQFDNIELIVDSSTSIDYRAGASIVELASGQSLVAKLLVGADGARSRVREAAGIGITAWDYAQHALVASVEVNSPQQDITWQQFTATGPMAFLPLDGNNASLVWYHQPQQSQQLLGLSDEAFLAELEKAFPACLPAITKLHQRGAFPLRRQHAQQYVKPGVALLGDAAHTIHPLAGQGVNIGLLDVAELADQLLGKLEGDAWQDESTLAAYERRRRQHNLLMMQTMDAFYRVFSNEVAPLKALRNIGLGLAGKVAPARRAAMRFAMGIEGPVPPLAKSA